MTDISEFLAHHGVLGMKWGKRGAKASSGPSEVTIKSAGKSGIKTTGGTNHLPHADAVMASIGKQKAKGSGLHSLSNAELKVVVERMNLESQYHRLAPASPGAKMVKEILLGVGKQQASKAANDYAAKQVGDFLKKNGQ